MTFIINCVVNRKVATKHHENRIFFSYSILSKYGWSEHRGGEEVIFKGFSRLRKTYWSHLLGESLVWKCFEAQTWTCPIWYYWYIRKFMQDIYAQPYVNEYKVPCRSGAMQYGTQILKAILTWQQQKPYATP
jgi:hypothetical protein